MHDTTPTQKKEAQNDSLTGASALGYATSGFAVIPLHGVLAGRCTCGRRDCPSPGKHPLASLVPNGLKDATADPEQCGAWWSAHPDANVAIPTGAVNGLCVLDVDGQAGRESLDALERIHGALPPTLTALTGREGGRHHYFADYRGEIRNSAGRLGTGLDVRGQGGYVVAPPSLHMSGRRYEWMTPIRRIAAMPDWLRALMLAEPAKAAAAPMPRPRIAPPAGDDHAALIRRGCIYIAAAEGAGKGRRNITCFSLAGHLASLRGEHDDLLAEPEILALVLDYATRCNPPPDPREVARTVRSALATGTPRDLKPPCAHPRNFTPNYRTAFAKGAA